MTYRTYDILYKPGQRAPYKLSRSKIELYVNCPRCFWLDRVLGIKRPASPPFLINSAVDQLLKREFDVYRKSQQPHPWFVKFNIDALPFAHADIDIWRENFKGIRAVHDTTNILVTGAVDDVWVNPKGELLIVDYKATAKNKEIVDLDMPGGWHDSYRRQMEIYQWLFRLSGFTVNDTGYFVYANGDAAQPTFDNKVIFRTNIFPYVGHDAWVDETLKNIKKTLESSAMPAAGQACEHCSYVGKRLGLAWDYLKKNTTRQ